MRDKKGRFADGEDFKENRFKKGDPRLIGNTYRKGIKPTNAFEVGHTPSNYLGEKPRTINHCRDGQYKIITLENETTIRESRGRTYIVKREQVMRDMSGKNTTIKNSKKEWL